MMCREIGFVNLIMGQELFDLVVGWPRMMEMH